MFSYIHGCLRGNYQNSPNVVILSYTCHVYTHVAGTPVASMSLASFLPGLVIVCIASPNVSTRTLPGSKYQVLLFSCRNGDGSSRRISAALTSIGVSPSLRSEAHGMTSYEPQRMWAEAYRPWMLLDLHFDVSLLRAFAVPRTNTAWQSDIGWFSSVAVIEIIGERMNQRCKGSIWTLWIVDLPLVISSAKPNLPPPTQQANRLTD